MEDSELLEGTESPGVVRSEALYAVWGTPGNSKKNFLRVDAMTTLGVTTLGREGIRHVPDGYLKRLCAFTLWSWGLQAVSRRHLQGLAG